MGTIVLILCWTLLDTIGLTMRTSLLVLAVAVGVALAGHCDHTGTCHDPRGGSCPCDGVEGSSCSCDATVRRAGEQCTTNDDCATTTCHEGQSVVCEHPETGHGHCHCKHM